ncbi:hypothetical protein JCGZ_19403 [Jatropha curcas]|uniref:Uncharacterized protein n=1 Tax=Jatropha curcas TaxID=180498 RepID=A0A067KAM2_JATCU|nr:hypothetical protein JCGZ_19403 [Jatropha curcas]
MINSFDVISVMMIGTKSTEEQLYALKLQLEALNHALQEKDSQIAYLMNRLEGLMGKSQMFDKGESASKGFTPSKEMPSKENPEKVSNLLLIARSQLFN